MIYTDSETWAGDIHPIQALRDYRQRVGHRRAAGRGRHGLERLLDRRPKRPGMLDVVGFDTATPQLISDFARGAL